jgi:hypothetical protein
MFAVVLKGHTLDGRGDYEFQLAKVHAANEGCERYNTLLNRGDWRGEDRRYAFAFG